LQVDTSFIHEKSNSSKVRFARSIIQTSETNVDIYIRKISEEEVKVDAMARLIDAECNVIHAMPTLSLTYTTQIHAR
jgi:predicted HTH domain antitoxin